MHSSFYSPYFIKGLKLNLVRVSARPVAPVEREMTQFCERITDPPHAALWVHLYLSRAHWFPFTGCEPVGCIDGVHARSLARAGIKHANSSWSVNTRTKAISSASSDIIMCCNDLRGARVCVLSLHSLCGKTRRELMHGQLSALSVFQPAAAATRERGWTTKCCAAQNKIASEWKKKSELDKTIESVTNWWHSSLSSCSFLCATASVSLSLCNQSHRARTSN
jgi:hypothetical protein